MKSAMLASPARTVKPWTGKLTGVQGQPPGESQDHNGEGSGLAPSKITSKIYDN